MHCAPARRAMSTSRWLSRLTTPLWVIERLAPQHSVLYGQSTGSAPKRGHQLVHRRGMLGIVEGDDFRRARQQAAVVAGHAQPGQRPAHRRADRSQAQMIDQHVEHVVDVHAAVVGLAGDPLGPLAARLGSLRTL